MAAVVHVYWMEGVMDKEATIERAPYCKIELKPHSTIPMTPVALGQNRPGPCSNPFLHYLIDARNVQTNQEWNKIQDWNGLCDRLCTWKSTGVCEFGGWQPSW